MRRRTPGKLLPAYAYNIRPPVLTFVWRYQTSEPVSRLGLFLLCTLVGLCAHTRRYTRRPVCAHASVRVHARRYSSGSARAHQRLSICTRTRLSVEIMYLCRRNFHNYVSVSSKTPETRTTTAWILHLFELCHSLLACSLLVHIRMVALLT